METRSPSPRWASTGSAATTSATPARPGRPTQRPTAPSRKIAGHGSLTTTQRYLHPDQESITAAGHLLSTHLNAGPDRARLRVV